MKSLPEEYAQFWQLWAQGEYFECHEVLEIAWRREKDPERKQFFQGLIHCSVALVHLQRKNAVGAYGQLRKANAKLQQFGGKYSNCDIQAVLEFVTKELSRGF